MSTKHILTTHIHRQLSLSSYGGKVLKRDSYWAVNAHERATEHIRVTLTGIPIAEVREAPAWKMLTEHGNSVYLGIADKRGPKQIQDALVTSATKIVVPNQEQLPGQAYKLTLLGRTPFPADYDVRRELIGQEVFAVLMLAPGDFGHKAAPARPRFWVYENEYAAASANFLTAMESM